MAQPIFCDWPDCGQEADVLLSHTHTGDVEAYCLPHFQMLCVQIVDQLAAAAAPEEPEQPAADPEERPQGRRRRERQREQEEPAEEEQPDAGQDGIEQPQD